MKSWDSHMEDRSNTENQQDQILAKLRIALSAAGDFPIRAKAISEMKLISERTDASLLEISNFIMAEPSLGCRVIHLVNKAYCDNSNPITTISQAVIQVGMRNIIDLCAGLVQTQKLVPESSSQSYFAENIQKSLLTGILTEHLVLNKDINNSYRPEEPFLAGSFFNMGFLLLSYYFPQVYEAAFERSESRNSTIENSIYELLGMDRSRLNLAITDSLQIPDFYRAVLIETAQDPSLSSSLLSATLPIAEEIAESMIGKQVNHSLEETIIHHSGQGKLYDEKELRMAVLVAGQDYHEKLEINELAFLNLPLNLEDFVCEIDLSAESSTERNEIDDLEEPISEEFNIYVADIREAVRNSEPVSSVVASVMEAIAFGLGFDRTVLLLVNGPKTALVGRMSLGDTSNLDPKSIARPLNDPHIQESVEIQSFLSGNITTVGAPLLQNGESFVALPIGYKKGSLGVIYADKISAGMVPIGKKVEKCLAILVEILDESVRKNS